MSNYPYGNHQNEEDEEIIERIHQNNNLAIALYAEYEETSRQAEENRQSLLRRNSTLVHVRLEKDRRRHEAHETLFRQYFSLHSTFSNDDFRRRFRMRKSLFNTILEAVCIQDDYFVQKRDGVGRLGLTPHLKICAALRYLCYGAAMDSYDEHFAVGKTTGFESLQRFCVAVIKTFGAEYMRKPTESDVLRLTTENAERGFPGMLGSIDCMHWKWSSCPIRKHGEYIGHKGAPTIIFEAVASQDAWIWHAFFGMPGSNNDINVLNRSLLFEDALFGDAPAVEYTINGNTYHMGYYLADGIYPKYASIVKSQKHPTSRKEQVFAAKQESERKDVERTFGILKKKFVILSNPGRLYSWKRLGIMMKACVILHNMVIHDERHLNLAIDYEFSPPVEDVPIQHNNRYLSTAYISRRATMTNPVMHDRLHRDLVEHIFQLYGSNPMAEE